MSAQQPKDDQETKIIQQEGLKAQLAQSIEAQALKVRQLKADKADKTEIDKEVEALLSLKKELALLEGDKKADSGKKSTKPAKTSFTLKTAKGTKDYNDKDMAIREKVFNTITKVFKKHGAVTIDTPVFELKEILAGKYGEDSKLIYDLADQGGEECSLRYDLTVPFARFLAMNGKEYPNIKRYQIAKVYRRDQPAMTKGRMREFYQCDFDIAGTYDAMIPDSEILRILCEALTDLDVGKFTVKINHRKILDGIFEVCGVPEANIRPISSAVDKLDKLPWADVKKEMVEEKGLAVESADKIGEYVKHKGGRDLLEMLKKDTVLMANANAAAGLKDMETLFDYLEIFDVMDLMSFDLSLARGLDYYTGIIYEAVTEKSAPPQLAEGVKPKKKEGTDELDESTVGVGSIAAGGRYDNLVGMFSGKNKKGVPNLQIPCVGVSIGVERVFSILMSKQKSTEIKSSETEVYVISVGDGLLKERMAIAKQLWDAGVKASYMFKNKPRLDKQFDVCEKEMIPLAVIIGKDELEHGQVRIKDMRAKDESQGGGMTIEQTDMIQEIKSRLELMK
ncbi:Cytoplasmic and mitochondrial histidine tRNA synthetase [Rhizopus stolonifer]|uniref:Histidine--tRNA ligase, mitochondrial n=1 Tax=Rhizopus stolonifer TaxID=4846 RepID=A0A367KXW9_RHIST|nr:Cytoplasmic and mitochondrial histidine tRNA synthetase [Rhizopus stolonifer]